MTVSNSTDANQTAVTLVEDARRLLGIHSEEESLQAHELQTGIRFLTYMLKDWQVDPDLGTWLETEGTLALTISTATYLFGAGGAFTTIPFEMVDIRISHSSGNEIPMTKMSRKSYNALPNKASTGYPTQYFYDRQRDSGTLKLWPVPIDGNFTIAFTYRRRIMDVDAGTDNLDIPPEWQWATVNNLATILITPYGRGGTAEAAQVITQADTSLRHLKAFDIANDEGSVVVAREPYRQSR